MGDVSAELPGLACSLSLSDEAIELIAERAASLVLARLSASSPTVPYLTVAEAAERLRAKPQRVYDLLSARRLTRYKDGRRTLVSRDEIDAYLGHDGRDGVAPRWPSPSRSRLRSGLA